MYVGAGGTCISMHRQQALQNWNVRRSHNVPMLSTYVFAITLSLGPLGQHNAPCFLRRASCKLPLCRGFDLEPAWSASVCGQVERWSDARFQLLESDNTELRQGKENDPAAIAEHASGTLIVIASRTCEQTLPKDNLHDQRLFLLLRAVHYLITCTLLLLRGVLMRVCKPSLDTWVTGVPVQYAMAGIGQLLVDVARTAVCHIFWSCRSIQTCCAPPSPAPLF
jgi:hypothetical protein